MANVAAPDLLVEQTQESIVASFPNLSRRQLFSSAATITAAGFAHNVGFEAHAKSDIAEQAPALAPPSEEPQAQKFCPVTLLRLREIAERNRVRQEAGLPLLSVPKELRRMKEAADAEKFRNFAEAHRRRVYEKMLARERRRRSDPHWTPTGMLSGGGLWFGGRVDEQLTKLYCRLTGKHQTTGALARIRIEFMHSRRA
jgi:hypothetical protein